MSRNPSAKGKPDANQAPIVEAIEMLTCPRPVMVLSAAGNGMEDLLVPLTIWVGVEGHRSRVRIWLPVECKVPPVRYTTAQKQWRERTAGWPRITVTSGQDAVDQIRELTR